MARPDQPSGRASQGEESMGVFLQQLANALCVGSLYALLAIGYTNEYGVLR